MNVAAVGAALHRESIYMVQEFLSLGIASQNRGAVQQEIPSQSRSFYESYNTVSGLMDCAVQTAGILSVKKALPTKTGKKSFFDNNKYSNKVKKQMNKNDFHSFSEQVKAYEKYGKVINLKRGDGIKRKMLKIPGTYKGRNGYFEFMNEPDGLINHRFYNPQKVKKK
ncbi:MAG: hypothetical protein JXK07_01045 [Spirochaetes bacterium]|nr:hypothetical protein [Spirochaetota bacterium]MBN2769853.1 hypothetical protein [Spirochaetota bacterium]